MPKKSEKCGSCTKTVSEKEQDLGIQCEICELWYHGKCQDVDDTLYKVLNQYNTEVHWYCKACNSGNGKILTAVAKLQTKFEQVERELCRIQNENRSELKAAMNEIKGLESKFHTIKNEFEQSLKESKLETLTIMEEKVEDCKRQEEQKMEQKERSMWSDIVKKLEDDGEWTEVLDKLLEKKMDTVTGDIKTMQATINDTRVQVKEERDKEGRRNNIILYRVPESKEVNFEDRLQGDIKMCLKFFNEGLQIGAVKDDTIKVIRLGRVHDTHDKDSNQELSRPLLVKLNDTLSRTLS
jgi:hypothetical protein